LPFFAFEQPLFPKKDIMEEETKKPSQKTPKNIDDRLKEAYMLAQKTIFNLEELSIYTGLSTSWLYKMSSRRLIPCSQPGGKKLFFEKVKIDEWLLRNKKVSQEEIEVKANTAVTLKK